MSNFHYIYNITSSLLIQSVGFLCLRSLVRQNSISSYESDSDFRQHIVFKIHWQISNVRSYLSRVFFGPDL